MQSESSQPLKINSAYWQVSCKSQLMHTETAAKFLILSFEWKGQVGNARYAKEQSLQVEQDLKLPS